MINEANFFCYKYPKNDRDYIYLERCYGKYKFDWEKEVVEKSPMFIRIKLVLSNKKRTELELWQKIEMEEIFREQDGKRNF